MRVFTQTLAALAMFLFSASFALSTQSDIVFPFADFPALPVLNGSQNALELRIMPLGASIMRGVGSIGDSGYG